MKELLILLLAVAILALLWARWRVNRHLRQLARSLRARQPFLHDQPPRSAACRDITDAGNNLVTENAVLRQQRSDNIAQLETTLGNLREAVMVVDERNVIHLANRALREIFPETRDTIAIRLELVVRSAAFHQFVAQIRRGEALPRQEFELPGAEGSRWIEASGAPITAPDGKTLWALFVIHDITRQRNLERLRKDFIANASHELRTPLSIIQGYVETLVDADAFMPAAERQQFLRTIQRHSERLNSIIQDLLVLSRLESANPGLEFEPVDLGQLITTFVDEQRAQPAAAGHALRAELAPDLGNVTADPARLLQVFDNLLENALKYTPSGSAVTVSARAIEADEVEVRVADNGPGIPAADLPRIFERFYRVDKGRSRGTGGTGLGLSIVKHIVQLHGGRVWAESAVGQGTTVAFRLRRQPRTAAPEPSA